MTHSAILGRKFNHPILNLGFSGNGKMEPEMADLFAELDPSVYVLDCLPNMVDSEVRERAEPFVRRLRAARPKTPIVLVEDRAMQDGFLVTIRYPHHKAVRAELKAAHDRLKKSGVQDLYYIPGEHLLGDDGEGSVDASHPTDLGYMRQAEIFAQTLGPLLKAR
jgi:lysophospholipase L1-like esterase